MNGYIPLEEQKRRRMLRWVGTASIVVTYITAVGSLWLGADAWRWWIVGTGTILPILISSAFVVSFDDTESDSDFSRLKISAAASVILALVATLIFGSPTARWILIGALAALLLVGALFVLVRWIVINRDEGPRKIALVGIVLAVAGLGSGIIFAPPIISWICTGIGASFLLPILGSRAHGLHGRLPQTHQHDHDFYMREPPYRYSNADLSQNGPFARLVNLMTEARHVLYGALDPHWRSGDSLEYRYAWNRSIPVAIAALDNLGFINRDFATELQGVFALESGYDDAWSEDKRILLAQLVNEIGFALSRIRAHQMGAEHPALRAIA